MSIIHTFIYLHIYIILVYKHSPWAKDVMERFLIQRAAIKKQLMDFTLTTEIREGLKIKGALFRYGL